MVLSAEECVSHVDAGVDVDAEDVASSAAFTPLPGEADIVVGDWTKGFSRALRATAAR